MLREKAIKESTEDTKSFNFQHYHQLLYIARTILHDVPRSEKAVIKAFQRLYNHIKNLPKANNNIRLWLMVALVRWTASAMDSGNSMNPAFEYKDDCSLSPLRLKTDAESLHVMQTALSGLSIPDADLIMMHAVFHIPEHELAGLLRIPQETMNTRLAEIKTKLMSLSNEQFDSDLLMNKVFDILLQLAAEQRAELEIAGLPAEMDLAQSEPVSKRFTRRMNTLILHSAQSSPSRIIKLAVSMTAAFILLLTIGAMSVEASRNVIKGWFTQTGGTTVQVTSNFTDYPPEITGLKGLFLPSYIPDGYKFEFYDIDEDSGYLYGNFTNDKGDNISFFEMNSSSTGKTILSFSGETTQVEVGGISGIMFKGITDTNIPVVSLIWEIGNKTISIVMYYCNDEKEVMLIANSLIYQ